ncbi:hypothetical protein BJ742DRAFT_810109 [Cladochytrium replicatum]|nr:hypothetical protein BJ742DRAFT_810109 [Cladochytrium replicatum]
MRLAVITYAPLARGLLALRENGSTARSLKWDQMYGRLKTADLEIMNRFAEVSVMLGFSLRSRTSNQAIACDIQLSQEGIKYLGEPYHPKGIESRQA